MADGRLPSVPQSMQQAFVAAARMLRAAGIETPELDARLLICHAAKLTHEAYVGRSDDALPPQAAARLSAPRLARAPG